MKKRLFSTLLSLVMVVDMTVPAFATELKSFSDVPTNHWAYKDIMNMVSKGVIAGTTTPDANGVGTFAPNAPMTRAQFVTVVTRYLYPTDLAEMGDRPEGTPWFFNNYQLALEKGILTNNDFAMNNMDVPMTRQEMAMVIVRACGELGETTTSTISNSRIPDYNSIGTAYRSYVKVAYSKGIIAGTDQAGTFNPLGTLNRAQASAVLNRLIEPETRKTIKDVEKTETVPQSTSSFVEGERHSYDIVKAGTTVTRKDGTKVVLAYKYGVLGAGQNVDIWSNCYAPKTGFVFEEGKIGPDSAIMSKSPYRNEMFSKKQWSTIYVNSRPASSIIGDYDGEAFNEYWIWDADAFNHGTGKNSGAWIWQGGDLA